MNTQTLCVRGCIFLNIYIDMHAYYIYITVNFNLVLYFCSSLNGCPKSFLIVSFSHFPFLLYLSLSRAHTHTHPFSISFYVPFFLTLFLSLSYYITFRLTALFNALVFFLSFFLFLLLHCVNTRSFILRRRTTFCIFQTVSRMTMYFSIHIICD